MDQYYVNTQAARQGLSGITFTNCITHRAVKPMKTGKNGDRRHKDNKGINLYRRKTDTKMSIEDLTSKMRLSEAFIKGLQYEVSLLTQARVKTESPKSLRRRVLEWLID